jgi:hypothetical protein
MKVARMVPAKVAQRCALLHLWDLRGKVKVEHFAMVAQRCPNFTLDFPLSSRHPNARKVERLITWTTAP